MNEWQAVAVGTLSENKHKYKHKYKYWGSINEHPFIKPHEQRATTPISTWPAPRRDAPTSTNTSTTITNNWTNINTSTCTAVQCINSTKTSICTSTYRISDKMISKTSFDVPYSCSLVLNFQRKTMKQSWLADWGEELGNDSFHRSITPYQSIALST
jgi:hypothetical protein